MEIKKRKTRMYEPWGYQDQNNYQSTQIIAENDLDSFFSGVSYKREDNKIHFTNKDGNEVGSLNVNDFIKSDQIVEKAWYEDGKIYVKFTNGDLITVDVRELIDENEFADGLQVIDGVVSVLRDPQSEKWLSVSINGVKVSGIQAEIDRLDGRIDDEIARATSEEQRIEAKLDQEIADRIADVDEEQARSEAAEQVLTTNLNNEITRATRTEQALNSRVDSLNDELDSEERRAEAAEQEIRTLLTNEIADRKADVDEEEARAKAAEQDLRDALDVEIARATSAETEIQDALNEEVERALSAETEIMDLLDALGSDKFDDVEYDSSAKTINFFADGEMVKALDATPFIVDGMIESVYVDHETEELVIVWNTETGTEETRISLSEIFNPEDYYTKDEIDEIVSGITASEEDLEDKIAQLRQALNEEIDRATTKEEELEGADIVSGNVASDATISVTKNNGNVITFASAEQIDLEAGEF
jgi:hypothetical protein